MFYTLSGHSCYQVAIPCLPSVHPWPVPAPLLEVRTYLPSSTLVFYTLVGTGWCTGPGGQSISFRLSFALTCLQHNSSLRYQTVSHTFHDCFLWRRSNFQKTHWVDGPSPPQHLAEQHKAKGCAGRESQKRTNAKLPAKASYALIRVRATSPLSPPSSY